MLETTLPVAVLGAGHGGLALAGYLAQQGHRVSLWTRSPARIAPLAALGRIRLTAAGATSLVPLSLATCSIRAALAGARHVVVAVPACAHADIARRCAPFLRDGQTVLLLPGRTGGALEFRRVLRRAGCRARILLGEANTFPFAARTTGPTEAVIHGTKADVLAAALPADHTPGLLAAWRPLLPMLSAAQSVLHTGFGNVGAVLHPTITLMNASRISRRKPFAFYVDGVTSEVADVLAAADAERLRLARAYSVPACSLIDWVADAYGHRGATIQQAIGRNPAYAGIRAPDTLAHRYLLEDVPTGLIPFTALGAAAGISMPTMRTLTKRAIGVLGGAAWQQPRTLEALGLSHLGTGEIRAVVERDRVATGRSPAPACWPAESQVASGWELVPQA